MEIRFRTNVHQLGPDALWTHCAEAEQSVNMPTLPKVGSKVELGGRTFNVERVGPHEPSGRHHVLLEPVYVPDWSRAGTECTKLRQQGFDVSCGPLDGGRSLVSS